MVAKGTGRWVYFSFSGGSSPPPAAGSFLPYSPSTIGRKALRFVLLCSRLVKKVLTSALHCSNYCCTTVTIVEWCGGASTSRHAESTVVLHLAPSKVGYATAAQREEVCEGF